MAIPIDGITISNIPVFVARAIGGIRPSGSVIYLGCLLFSRCLLNIGQHHFMNGLFYEPAISFAYQKRWNTHRVALAIVLHGSGLDFIGVDHDCHDGSKLLDVFDLLDEVTVASVDHDDVAVTVKRSFFEMSFLEVGFSEWIATILISKRVVDASLEHAILLVGAKAAQARLDLTLVGRTVEIELPGELVRVKHEEIVGGDWCSCTEEQEKYCAQLRQNTLLHFDLNVNDT